MAYVCGVAQADLQLNCSRRISHFIIFVTCILLLATSMQWASAAEHDTQRYGDDIYASGGRVALQTESSGDAVVAGGRVSVTGRIGGDAMLAGGNINIDSNVEGDLYAAGGEVKLSATVTNDARLAGGSIVVTPEARVNGSLAIFGGRITLEGQVGEYVLISGGRIYVNGAINGDLRVTAGELSLGPNAVVQGQLHYRGNRPPTIDPAATVVGGISAPRVDAGDGVSWGWFILLLFSTIVVSAVWLLVASGAARRISNEIRAHPVYALGIGIAVLVVTPLPIVLLMISVVGVPLAFLLLSTFLVLVILGYVSTAVVLGDLVVERSAPATRRKRILATVVALLALHLLALLPYIGWLVWPIAVAIGVGGVVRTVVALLSFKRKTA